MAQKKAGAKNGMKKRKSRPSGETAGGCGCSVESGDVACTPGYGAGAGGCSCSLEKEREEYREALIRERADFENYKKRNASLASASYNNGIIDTVTAVLPVLDNFERALCTECGDKAFFDGMEMIKRQLVDVLTSLGVEEIDVEGKFDPEMHNAVMQVDEEGFEANDIVETLQKGYRLKDKILRHAMVKVNK